MSSIYIVFYIKVYISLRPHTPKLSAERVAGATRRLLQFLREGYRRREHVVGRFACIWRCYVDLHTYKTLPLIYQHLHMINRRGEANLREKRNDLCGISECQSRITYVMYCTLSVTIKYSLSGTPSSFFFPFLFAFLSLFLINLALCDKALCMQ